MIEQINNQKDNKEEVNEVENNIVKEIEIDENVVADDNVEKEKEEIIPVISKRQSSRNSERQKNNDVKK